MIAKETDFQHRKKLHNFKNYLENYRSSNWVTFCSARVIVPVSILCNGDNHPKMYAYSHKKLQDSDTSQDSPKQLFIMLIGANLR